MLYTLYLYSFRCTQIKTYSWDNAQVTRQRMKRRVRARGGNVKKSGSFGGGIIFFLESPDPEK